MVSMYRYRFSDREGRRKNVLLTPQLPTWWVLPVDPTRPVKLSKRRSWYTNRRLYFGNLQTDSSTINALRQRDGQMAAPVVTAQVYRGAWQRDNKRIEYCRTGMQRKKMDVDIDRPKTDNKAPVDSSFIDVVIIDRFSLLSWGPLNILRPTAHLLPRPMLLGSMVGWEELQNINKPVSKQIILIKAACTYFGYSSTRLHSKS